MIRKYLGYRKLLFLFALLSGGLCALFWQLNGAPARDVLYSLLLMAAALAFIVAIDFFLFARNLKQLKEIEENLLVFEQTLPEGGNAIEHSYATIAQGLLTRLRSETDALDALRREDIEYYTLWMHQIKTPIAALRLLLESGQASEAQMRQELFAIERYVEMALGYARAGNLSSDLIIKQTDVAAVLHESIRKYAPLFIAKGLRATVTPFSLTALTDAKWLAFVFEQLLSNAAKYTSEGGITVSCRDNALVLEDSGTGIRPEDLPRVFERGYTGFNGRQDKRASGLGLGLAKKVADALGIALRLESEYGKGTRVLLLFPVGNLQVE